MAQADMSVGYGFKLADCRVDRADNTLCFTGEDKISLQPKFIDVLTVLAERYPEVVTREVLIDKIWDGNTYVGSRALTNAIWHLRQQLARLDDDTVIDTVRKTGYRLLIKPEFDYPVSSGAGQTDSNLVDDYHAESSGNRLPQRKPLVMVVGVASVLLSLVFMAGMLMWHAQHEDHEGHTSSRYLTREDGSERYPSVSPDGRYLVYGASSQGSGYSLFLKPLDNPAAIARRLTGPDINATRAIWHPDGKRLFFSARRPEDNQLFINEMTLDSGQITYLQASHSSRTAIDLSPDGRYLSMIYRMPSDDGDEVYTLDLTVADSAPVKLSCIDGCSGNARDLAYSPDGQYLAIARRQSNITEDIFLYNLTSGKQTRLTEGMEDIRGLSWHPDGRYLVFGLESSGRRRGYRLDVTSGALVDLAVPGLSYPQFVPGTHQVVYNHYARQYDIAYLDLARQTPQTPFPLLYSGHSQRLPDYSPTSGRVVYISNETGANEVWTADRHGRNRIQHTQMQGRALYPRWSADGRKIAFIAPDEMDEGNQIYVLDLDTGALAVLPSPYRNHSRVFWGPDDSYVFSTVGDDLIGFSVTGGPLLQLPRIRVDRGQMLDSQQLVYSRKDRPGLWLLNLAAYISDANVRRVAAKERSSESEHILKTMQAASVQLPVDITTSPLPEPSALLRGRSRDNSTDWGNAPKDVLLADKRNWVVTDEGVYFKQRVLPGEFMLSRLMSDGTVERILRVPSSYLSTFGTLAYIPGLQRLLMTQTQYPQRDILLLEHPRLQ